jgi:hypothetical protein
MRAVTPGLVLLRVAALAALVLLLWNPATAHRAADAAPPLVLLDASLSMAGTPGDPDRWRRALDSARALARGGVVWRFGHRVAAFDTAPPADGASRLGPALEAAAARGGDVIVVTDGAVEDFAGLPTDVRQRPRVVTIERPPAFDAFVADVGGPRVVGSADTIRLRVSYGTAGKGEGGRGKGTATLAISAGGRRLASRTVPLPDSGVVAAELTLPASRFPPGWVVLEVGLEGVGDAEPRDDARLHLVEVSREPRAVLLAAPPDWDTRFFATALRDVARVAVRVFVQAEPGRWRDGTTLQPVSPREVARAVAAARLVVLAGDPDRLRETRPAPRAAVLVWHSAPEARGVDGDWYVDPPPVSPLAGALAGVAWDSLPPVTSIADARTDSAAVVALSARLGRRGTPRPVVLVNDSGGRRRAKVLGRGIWRWAFRGGAGAVAHRSLVAGLADWLLAEGAGSREQVVPETPEVANGLPLVWRWTGDAPPRDLTIVLEPLGPPAGRARVDTLRFDAAGRAELSLPPGVYRYRLAGDGDGGLVAVEQYSDEWRPAGTAMAGQPGTSAARRVAIALRDRWWMFALVLGALVAEWVWRRRQGLP